MSSIPRNAEGSEPASPRGAPETALLSIEDLRVRFPRAAGAAAVDGVSLTVRRGECLGVVGESGAGKSLTFLAALGLAPPGAEVSGRVRLGSSEVLGLEERALDALRGRRVGFIFQDPMTSLTPHLTVGAQLVEPIVRHAGLGGRAARGRARELLERVRMGDAARRLRQYPHELSGGMRQRVMIALALACEPELLIADEPTTALDVTLQAQVLALLAQIKRERRMGLVLITHDFGAVAGVADRVTVMRAGRLIESAPVATVLKRPSEPYTRELLRAASEPPEPVATPGRAAHEAGGAAEVLAVEELEVRFNRAGGVLRRREFAALEAVTLHLAAGESLGVVGESGCGKSTLTRAALRLIHAHRGRVLWLGRDVGQRPARRIRRLRRDLQLIFQDPLASLDPHLTVERLVGEPLEIHHPELGAAARRERVRAMLARVGLEPALYVRRAHELSGGQCQRVGIARAMILEPRVLVCDEPLSALDVRAQRQIRLLLADLKAERGTSLLFVSHDLALVRHVCERSLVLYLGRMAELGPTAALFERPLHPYTRELIEAIAVADPDVQPARLAKVRLGEPQASLERPQGCAFRARCPLATAVCAERAPPWVSAGDGRWVACHHFERGADGMLAP